MHAARGFLLGSNRSLFVARRPDAAGAERGRRHGRAHPFTADYRTAIRHRSVTLPDKRDDLLPRASPTGVVRSCGLIMKPTSTCLASTS